MMVKNSEDMVGVGTNLGVLGVGVGVSVVVDEVEEAIVVDV